MNAKCNLCSKKVERNDLKIKCVICTNFNHAICAKLEKRELEILERSRSYKCNMCLALRRLSSTRDNIAVSSSPTQIASTLNKLSSITNNLLNPSSNDAQILQENESTITLEKVYSQILQIQNCVSSIITPALAKLEHINTEALQKIEQLEEKNQFLSNKLIAMESRINILEQKELSSSVDFVGIPDINKNNCREKVMEVIKTGLSLDNFNEEDISECFIKKKKTNFADVLSEKYGESSSATKTPLSIVAVKFTSEAIKRKILKQKYNIKKKLNAGIFGDLHANQPIYINEAMTVYMRELYSKVQLQKRNKNFKFVWVRNGSILLRKKEGDKAIVIRTISDIPT